MSGFELDFNVETILDSLIFQIEIVNDTVLTFSHGVFSSDEFPPEILTSVNGPGLPSQVSPILTLSGFASGLTSLLPARKPQHWTTTSRTPGLSVKMK